MRLKLESLHSRSGSKKEVQLRPNPQQNMPCLLENQLRHQADAPFCNLWNSGFKTSVQVSTLCACKQMPVCAVPNRSVLGHAAKLLCCKVPMWYYIAYRAPFQAIIAKHAYYTRCEADQIL